MKAVQLLNCESIGVSSAVPGSAHGLYSLALVVGGVCVLRYDNGAGKGNLRMSELLKPRTASPHLLRC
jgi:hypothetical protein